LHHAAVSKTSNLINTMLKTYKLLIRFDKLSISHISCTKNCPWGTPHVLHYSNLFGLDDLAR
jgi:hypothetical protein